MVCYLEAVMAWGTTGKMHVRLFVLFGLMSWVWPFADALAQGGQSTTGDCSPAFSEIRGNVFLNCATPQTKPPVNPGEEPLAYKALTEDTTYYMTKLGSWPKQQVAGDEVIVPLERIIEKLDKYPNYEKTNPHSRALVYRMIGGSYLLNSKLEMPDKLRAAIPSLRKSLELWPDQRRLPENVRDLEMTLKNSGIDTKRYFTTVLQILRGPDDPEIATLVDGLSGAAQRVYGSAEHQAQYWLLNEATGVPISSFLDALKVELKKERNIDADIQISSKTRGDGRVEVRAIVGPNVFLWNVNFNQKTFEPASEFTRTFMDIVVRADR
jgi:hypothetical protein